METQLRDRVVMITGCENPRGIGAATARVLAGEGAAIALTYPGPVSADAVAADLRKRGGRVAALQIDLTEPASIPQLFDRVEHSLGPVDVLINNAAHSAQDTFDSGRSRDPDWAGRELESVSATTIDRHFAVNSRAVALMMAEYARRFVRRGGDWGRIVNISTDGAPGFPGEVSYGASKAALESYSRAAAAELAPYGITVNIVSPGPIQTGWIPVELENEMAQLAPAGRLGQPEDVADVVLLLVTPQARWLTGQTLHAGGGHRMI